MKTFFVIFIKKCWILTKSAPVCCGVFELWCQGFRSVCCGSRYDVILQSGPYRAESQLVIVGSSNAFTNVLRFRLNVGINMLVEDE